jgi:glycine betaine/proline transport system ATP-binding protein
MSAQAMESQTKIEIRDLYKVFGPDPQRALRAVLDEGLGKTELLEQYQHVLGLENINVDVKAGQITVIMGLSGSGTSTV